MFAAHRGEKVIDKLKTSNTRIVFVPAGCTDELQPLDLYVSMKILNTEIENGRL